MHITDPCWSAVAVSENLNQMMFIDEKYWYKGGLFAIIDLMELSNSAAVASHNPLAVFELSPTMQPATDKMRGVCVWPKA